MGLSVREELICGDFMCGEIRYFRKIGKNFRICEFTKVSGGNALPSYRLSTFS